VTNIAKTEIISKIRLYKSGLVVETIFHVPYKTMMMILGMIIFLFPPHPLTIQNISLDCWSYYKICSDDGKAYL